MEDKKYLGEIFGVKVHSPITRFEIREVIKKQIIFEKKIEREQNLTEDQARLEVMDIFDSFLSKITIKERSVFEKIHAEEVSAAPRNWFDGEEGSNSSEDVNFLKSGIAGNLYGIEVVYPFIRENIRKVVIARNELIKNISKENNISHYQAANDLSDMQMIFLKKFSFEDQEQFLAISTEETTALTNAINDETIKINQEIMEREASNANIAGVIASIVGFICLMFLFYVVFR
ncbi:hypothetical protein [Acinetobacter soli]